MATSACRWLTIRQHGFVLRFHPSNLASQLWIDPHERDEPLRFFRDYLQPGDRVIDVGANIGDTVLVASVQVGPSGRVIALEPHPRTFQFLRENIALNRAANVELFNVAAGAAAAAALISDDRRDDMNRIGGGSVPVTVARLDDLVGDEQSVTLLKIDVEGYEKLVLDGAPRLLARTACVYLEVCAPHFAHFGYSSRELLTRLVDSGFHLFLPGSPGEYAVVTAAYDTESFQNVIAVRDVADFRRRTGWSQRAGA